VPSTVHYLLSTTCCCYLPLSTTIYYYLLLSTTITIHHYPLLSTTVHHCPLLCCTSASSCSMCCLGWNNAFLCLFLSNAFPLQTAFHSPRAPCLPLSQSLPCPCPALPCPSPVPVPALSMFRLASRLVQIVPLAVGARIPQAKPAVAMSTPKFFHTSAPSCSSLRTRQAAAKRFIKTGGGKYGTRCIIMQKSFTTILYITRQTKAWSCW
jgi:hypothetical protein